MRRDREYPGYLGESTSDEDAAWLERVPPELDWDESEASLVVTEIVGRNHTAEEPLHRCG